MKRTGWQNRRGLSLIELAVTLSLIGLMSTLAVVYVSSGETALRSTLHDFRFDMELAKSEAVTRNTETILEFFLDAPTADNNEDGLVDRRDRCYVIYQDLNGNGAYDPDPGAELPERITSTPVPSSLRFSGYGMGIQGLKFEPLGGIRLKTGEALYGTEDIVMESLVANDCDPVTFEQECLVTSYVVSLHPVGRIEVKDDPDRHPEWGTYLRPRCEPLEYCMQGNEDGW